MLAGNVDQLVCVLAGYVDQFVCVLAGYVGQLICVLAWSVCYLGCELVWYVDQFVYISMFFRELAGFVCQLGLSGPSGSIYRPVFFCFFLYLSVLSEICCHGTRHLLITGILSCIIKK